MEELPGRRSSIHRHRGTPAGCRSAWRRRRRRRMPRIQTFPSHHRCLGGGTGLHLVATTASPVCPSWFPYLSFSCTFCHLSPHGRGWKQLRRFSALRTPLSRVAPPWSPGFRSRLKEVEEGAWGEAVVIRGQAIMQRHRGRRCCQVPGNLELITD